MPPGTTSLECPSRQRSTSSAPFFSASPPGRMPVGTTWATCVRGDARRTGCLDEKTRRPGGRCGFFRDRSTKMTTQQAQYQVFDAGEGRFVKAWARGVSVEEDARAQLARVARL